MKPQWAVLVGGVTVRVFDTRDEALQWAFNDPMITAGGQFSVKELFA